MAETSVVAVRAAVYHYNPGTNTWASADRGLSRMDLYHSQQTRRYRVVGVSAKTGDTVVNSPLTRAVVYQQVTPLFHQWSDTLFSYGVNFATLEEAQRFAQAVDAAVLHMTADDVPPPPVLAATPASGSSAASASAASASAASATAPGSERGAGSGRASEGARSERSDREGHEKRKKTSSSGSSSGSVSKRDADALRAELQQFVISEIAAALGTTGTARLGRSTEAAAPEVSPSKARRRDSKHISLHMKRDTAPPADGAQPSESRSSHSSHNSCSTPRHVNNTVVITPPS